MALPVNMSGTYFQFVPYGVDAKTGTIDYDELTRLAMEHKPKLIVAGASAYARAIDFAKFREVADACGAYLMVDMAHIAGLVAAGCISRRCLTPTLSPPLPTRPCAAPAAA